jgi:multidrug efflux pump subunit AcrA (membrane-fusion protein)
MSAIPSPVPVRTPEKPVPSAVPAKPKKSRSWIGVVVVLALIAGGALAYRALTKPAQPKATVTVVKTTKVVVAPLNVVLRVAGQTSARNFANITAPLLRGPENRGSLVLLDLAKSGSFVNKGQLVARLDAQTAQDHIDDLKDTLQAAENDIRKRQAEQKVEWEDMQQTLRVAKSQLDKAKLDYQTADVKVDIERELLKLAVDEADARYAQQQKDVATRRASQAAEIRILQLTLERHKRHMGRHTHDLERYTIYAPMDGLIVMASVFRGGEMAQIQQGDQVWPGQQILKVVDAKSMQVEGSVSQADSGDLRLSQLAGIGFDAFPDMHLKGKVYSIGALAVGGWRQNYYIRNVPVRVTIEGTDPRLIPDLSAHCDITLESVPDQLQVPAGAVQEENGKAFVNVKAGEGFERREVTLGKRSFTHIAIQSGLKAGDEVQVL